MAPVVKVLERHSDRVECCVCVTAQHREMLDSVLRLFNVTPKYDLNVMTEDQPLGRLTASILTSLDPVLERERPDWLLVQGDTTTAMAAALLGFYHHVQIGHIEAGLRTHDKYAPFPEEINRRIADTLADVYFAPTEWARDNLIREGTDPDSVFLTGNPVIDALHIIADKPYDPSDSPLESIDWNKRILLVTAHRRENFGAPLEGICTALTQIANRYSNGVEIVYPVHLNPSVQRGVRSILSGYPNIKLLPPLDYQPLVYLMRESYLILTDSGGIQEEAPSLGKPVLVLRDKTERPEGVKAGTAKLIGTHTEDILRETNRLIDDPCAYEEMAKAVNPYGDGHAAERIADVLLNR